MTDRQLHDFQILTFDCYGTLIDWEAGILAALRSVLDEHGVTAGDDQLLEQYAGFEAAAEGGPYLPYRQVLARALAGVAGEHGFEPSAAESARFSESVGDWPAFADSAAALAQLKEHFKLGVITNCDTDLFARSNERLGVEFDWVITAQQLGSYKPNPRNFELARAQIGGPPERHLHVAQSLFHDHVPAHALGLTTAWIDRRHGRPGSGATPPAQATPDFTFPDMASFAEAAIR
ncbi:MAG TPA: haloacid dehalogenase type II [Candidatus Limnocylindrales bacterium]|nr:haloacid dehalogenase type II [Candidatus Limnocylindrales bacterium]